MHEETSKQPTWVNNRQWWPVWGNERDLRGDDQTELHNIRVGTLNDLKLELLAVGPNRGCQGITRRSPVTARIVDGALIISIPDREFAASWYRFQLGQRDSGNRTSRSGRGNTIPINVSWQPQETGGPCGPSGCSIRPEFGERLVWDGGR